MADVVGTNRLFSGKFLRKNSLPTTRLCSAGLPRERCVPCDFSATLITREA
jgi:hypothetical protein